MRGLLCAIAVVSLISASKGEVTISPTDGTVNEGDTFQFTCTNSQNSGAPTLSINNDDSSSDLYNRIVQQSDDVMELIASLPDVTRSETGTRFVCTSGGSSAEVTITVNYPPLYQQPADTEYGYFVGSEFSLTLSLEEGSPASSYTWERDGVQLEGSQEGITLAANSITISSVSKDDNGTYTVTASNTAGQDTVSFDLSVYFGPYLQAGDNGTENITMTTGEMFVVDCTVTDSYPSVVTLYYFIDDGPHQDIINDPVVTFINLSTADSGAYQCIADSGQATTTYTFNLDVSEATSPPETLPTNSSTDTDPSGSPNSGKGLTITFVIFLLLVCISLFF